MLARAFWTLLGAVIQGATSQQPLDKRRGTPPDGGVRMVRDPVCGTFLPPTSALALTAPDGAVRYFCSETCRAKFQAGRRTTS